MSLEVGLNDWHSFFALDPPLPMAQEPDAHFPSIPFRLDSPLGVCHKGNTGVRRLLPCLQRRLHSQ